MNTTFLNMMMMAVEIDKYEMTLYILHYILSQFIVIYRAISSFIVASAFGFYIFCSVTKTKHDGL